MRNKLNSLSAQTSLLMKGLCLRVICWRGARWRKDRFLIVDEDVYHIGASLKDLGKRLFAFDKMGLSKDLILSQVR